jgi:hypothetical protein
VTPPRERERSFIDNQEAADVGKHNALSGHEREREREREREKFY